MPGTLIRDTRGLLPRCNLLRVLHLRQRIHGPCTLPISQFPVLPISPNPTAPQTACSSTPSSSSRINCRESLQQQCNHKALATAVCNDTRFLGWTLLASRSTAEAFTPRQLFCVKLDITQHQTPKWIHTFRNTYGTIVFLFFSLFCRPRTHPRNNENHCHFIALCFTSKCGFLKDLRKKRRYHGSAQ
jgi:hypothetical protein